MTKAAVAAASKAAGSGATSAAAATPAAAAAAKKKSTPKSRKRKVSDAGVATKTGVSPARKSAGDSSAGTGAGGASGSAASGSNSVGGASGAGAGTAGAHATGATANADGLPKPFVKGELTESIKHMMFGFGDAAEPLDATAELMEDMVVEYIHAMTKKAMDLAQVKGKLDTECFIFLLRKDPERYERIAELLRANDELRAVLNSGFDPSDEKLY